MLKEEAIDILFGCIEAHSEEENEALDMAIEALKGEDHDGCDGCRYEANHELSLPCVGCKQNYVDKYVPMPEHDREWIIGCIKHDGFVKTDRGDKANQIILDALSADNTSTNTSTKSTNISTDTSADRPTDVDLISRAEAIEAIELVDWYHQNSNKDMVHGANDDEHQAWYKADDVYKALEAVPSADRPRGEWKQIEINGYPYAVCDQCHLLADIVEKDGELVMSMANADEKCANFCSNCGADMRGENE